MDREQLYLDRLRKALDAVKSLKAKVADLEARGPVAIVGVGCRLPGRVTDLDGLWRLLVSGDDPIAPVPPDRWDLADWTDPDPEAPGKTPVTEGGFLEGVQAFDAAFFGITPREAAVLDPQQRLLLEVTWEALEHAAIAPGSVAGSRTGVFVGLSTADHRKLLERRPPEQIDAWVGTGNVASTAVGRLAYVLGTHGPAIALDTACSSSLVALHLAVRSLRAGECDLALAGGVNVLLDPEGMVYFSKLRALSPTARCRSFSADADGYVRSEGAGMVVLKRLADAERDGDPILAVLRGSATNQDGRSNGLTAPSAAAQAAVIRDALRDAGATPADVSAVECHATGTPLGDPIEVEALTAVFDTPVALGALKSVVGHLEAAAGVAGVAKAVAVLQHGRLPANLHFTAPNPHIVWGALRTPPAAVRGLIGVSSFGFGGSNAHAVLGPAPARPLGTAASAARTLALSAHTEPSLRALARRWARAVEARPGALDDLCHTALAARDRHPLTLVVHGDPAALVQALDAVADGGPIPTGAWPEDPGPGRRTHAPTTAWDRSRHWAVELPRPRRGDAPDPLAGCRWRLDWVPVHTAPAEASPVSAIAAEADRRDPRPLVVCTDDLAGTAALAARHPRVRVTVVQGDPVIAPGEDRLVWRDGWLAPRLRRAPAGPRGRLDGKVVGVHGPAHWEADARALGASAVNRPPVGGEDVWLTTGPLGDAPTQVRIADAADWLSDDPDAASATAAAVSEAHARGATVLRLGAGPGLDPLDPDQRRAALAEALVGDVWAMGLDPRRWRQTWPGLADRALLRGLDDAAPTHTATDPDALRAAIIAAVCGVLGLDMVRPDRSLPELGMDSVMALELRNRVEHAAGVRLAATAAFDHPTVDALVDAVSTALGWDAVDALSDDEAEAALLAELDALGG